MQKGNAPQAFLEKFRVANKSMNPYADAGSDIEEKAKPGHGGSKGDETKDADADKKEPGGGDADDAGGDGEK